MRLNAYSFLTALKAVLPFSPKNDVRYYLNGVHLLGTDGGFFIEATDGYTAARVKVDAQLDGPLDLVMPRGFCEKVANRKVPVRERDSLELELAYSFLATVVSLDGQSMEANTVDCKYVDLHRVLGVPAVGKPSDRRGFNAEYMARAAKSASMLAHPKYKGVALVGGSAATDNFVFEVSTAHGEFPAISEPALFVVCPMRL